MAAEEKKSPQEKILSTNAYNSSARRWLYLGVGTMLTVMLGLWGYSTFSTLSFFDWGNSREAKLFRDTKHEFNALVKDNPVLDEKIKDRLAAIKQEATSSTMSSVTTSATAANTTAATSSTK